MAEKDRQQSEPGLLASLEGDRKLVTVMFADISGFTAMSALLDPETVVNLLNDAFAKLGDIVLHYQGHIDKFIGDCIMAVFGAPRTHENDAELALRAALDMQQAIEHYNATLALTLPKRLRLHIGINSGWVVAGKIGHGAHQTYTVIGDAVNLASRLEGLAEAGEIVVGATTYKETLDLFDFTSREPRHIKGKRGKIPLYTLTGLKETPTPKHLAALTGRDEELNELVRAGQELLRGKGRIIGITGEVGMGKSRLIEELGRMLRNQPLTLLSGNCTPLEHDQPYQLFADIYRRSLHLSALDGPAEIGARFEDYLRDHLDWSNEPARALAHALSTLLIHPLESSGDQQFQLHSARQNHRKLLHALERLLEREAIHRPVVMVLEDVQWADESSTKVLLWLARRTTTLPVLLIYTARPGPAEQHLAKRLAHAHALHYHALTLEELSPEYSRSLLGTMLGSGYQLTEALEQMILEQAAGNPLYIEELAQFLHQEEASRLVGKPGRSIPLGTNDILLPPLLEGTIAAGIDRLEEKSKRLLELAAVIGPSFTHSLLLALLGEEREILTQLTVLKQQHFIGETLNGEQTYLFRHELTRRVAYERLLLQRRRRYHHLVATTIERIYSAQLSQYADLLVWHYSQAEEWEKALSWAMQAVALARARHANPTAVRHCRRGLEILSRLQQSQRAHGENGSPKHLLQERQLELLLQMAELLDESNYIEAVQAFEQASRIVHERSRSRNLSEKLLQSSLRIAEGQATRYLQQGNLESARKTLHKGLQMAGESHQVRESRIGYLYVLLAEVERLAGEQAAQTSAVHQALETSKALEDQHLKALAHLALADLALVHNDLARAQDAAQSALTLLDEYSQFEGVATIAEVLWRAGTLEDAAAAQEQISTALPYLAQHGLLYEQVRTLLVRARITQAAGKQDEANAALAEAGQLALLLGNPILAQQLRF